MSTNDIESRYAEELSARVDHVRPPSAVRNIAGRGPMSPSTPWLGSKKRRYRVRWAVTPVSCVVQVVPASLVRKIANVPALYVAATHPVGGVMQSTAAIP